MPFGIALAGGGTRGAAHAGVLVALEEAELFPSSISGTSAGAIVAGLYACGKSSAQLSDIVSDMAQKGNYFKDWDIMGFIKSIPLCIIKKEISISGFIKGTHLENYIKSLTNGMLLKDAVMRVVIPAVDLNSGRTIAYTNSMNRLHTLEDVIWDTSISIYEAVRASASFPAVFQPKCIQNRCLVDGGVTNVLPVNLLLATGSKPVIAVDLDTNYKSPEENNVFEVVTHSYHIMSRYLKNLTSTGEVYLLRPPLPKEAGLLTFKYMEECKQIGYEYTKKHIKNIKKALQLFP